MSAVKIPRRLSVLVLCPPVNNLNFYTFTVVGLVKASDVLVEAEFFKNQL